jgi:hypothetical protein
MPTEIRWHVPQRVIYVRFFDTMTMDAIIESMNTINQYFDEGIPLVHIIMDVGDVTAYPSLTDLARGLKYERNDKQGWSIYVGAQGVARFVASVTSQLSGSRFRMFDTLEEALAFLAEQDETLEF